MSSTVAAIAHRPEKISHKALVRLQAWSGLAFASFLVLHLGNVGAAVFGQAAYDGYMRWMRFYYQFPLVEVVCVLGAALVHMGAGVVRIARRRRAKHNDKAPTLRVRLHRYSGYMMMLAFAGHVAATRLPSLVGTPVDYSFIHFSLVYGGAFFYPYYAVFAVSGLYHLTHGTIAAARIVGARLPKTATSPRSRLFWLWVSAGPPLVIVGLLALGGVLYDADASRLPEWMAFYEDLLPEGWSPW
jgi:hypothetical protein